MKALMKRKYGYDNMELVEIDEPVVSETLVKVKVEYSGICGTDLHAFEGKYSGTTTPVILGHEFSGTVVDIGSDVKNVKVGDRVTSETTFATCGVCEYCKSKDYNLCSQRKGVGTQVNGSFAEFVVTREESVHVIPDNVSLLAAALTEPLSCGVHAALEKTSIQKEEFVLIFGPGAIGLLMSQIAKAKGAFVILAGVTKDEERFKIAIKIGVDAVVDQQKENLEQIVMELTEGRGVHKVFECSGAVPALNKGLELVKKKGEVVQLGVFVKDYNEINTGIFFPKEIKYIGSRSQKPSSWKIALDLLEQNLVNPEKIVTMITPIENWREGFQRSIDCTEVKVVLKCSE